MVCLSLSGEEEGYVHHGITSFEHPGVNKDNTSSAGMTILFFIPDMRKSIV